MHANKALERNTKYKIKNISHQCSGMRNQKTYVIGTPVKINVHEYINTALIFLIKLTWLCKPNVKCRIIQNINYF